MKNDFRKNVSYQLGYFVGEHIIRWDIPTLNVDLLQTRRLINVSDEENEKHSRLNKLWRETAMKKRSDKKNKELKEEYDKRWNDLLVYYKKLVKKYIPEELECYVNVLEDDGLDVEKFKLGLTESLWQSDLSHYSCNPSDVDIKFSDSVYGNTKITLKRGD